MDVIITKDTNSSVAAAAEALAETKAETPTTLAKTLSPILGSPSVEVTVSDLMTSAYEAQKAVAKNLAPSEKERELRERREKEIQKQELEEEVLEKELIEKRLDAERAAESPIMA